MTCECGWGAWLCHAGTSGVCEPVRARMGVWGSLCICGVSVCVAVGLCIGLVHPVQVVLLQ